MGGNRTGDDENKLFLRIRVNHILRETLSIHRDRDIKGMTFERVLQLSWENQDMIFTSVGGYHKALRKLNKMIETYKTNYILDVLLHKERGLKYLSPKYILLPNQCRGKTN